MNEKPMKLLIVEDDAIDCNNFINALKNKNEFDLISITDSDIEALSLVRMKHPEGIILDIELNNTVSGNTDSLDFLDKIKELKLGYEPIIVVTTHVNSKRTYDILHRKGVDIILYKDNPTYSSEHVLNKLLALRKSASTSSLNALKEELIDNEKNISNLIYHELDLIGVTQNLKGRQYIHDAILYLIQNPNSDLNVIQYLTNIHKKAGNTITNGIQTAIIHAWRVSSLEDLSMYYTAKINYETGVPTPMEFIYYYVDKIKKLI